MLAAAGALLTWWIFPAFAQMYWLRLSISAEFLFTRTEGVLSGRVASWQTLAGWIAAHPWQAMFGIGYKTLPYTNYPGQLRWWPTTCTSACWWRPESRAWRRWCGSMWPSCARRRELRSARFFGMWMLCFWAGQTVQMASGDLLTYWRVLPVYFWILALAAARMKLLLLDQFSDLGGAQQNLLELLPALRDAGWQRAGRACPAKANSSNAVRALGFEAERIECGPYASGRKSAADFGRFLAGTPRLARQMRRMAQRVDADLVYLNGPRLLPAAAMAGLRRARCCFTPTAIWARSGARRGRGSRCGGWTPGWWGNANSWPRRGAPSCGPSASR